MAIVVAPFNILFNFLHVLQHFIGSDDFEAHIDIEVTALILLDQTEVEARPNSDIFSIRRMCKSMKYSSFSLIVSNNLRWARVLFHAGHVLAVKIN